MRVLEKKQRFISLTRAHLRGYSLLQLPALGVGDQAQVDYAKIADLPIADCGLRIADCGLRAVNARRHFILPQVGRTGRLHLL
jgi:hypothetical protein